MLRARYPEMAVAINPNLPQSATLRAHVLWALRALSGMKSAKSPQYKITHLLTAAVLQRALDLFPSLVFFGTE